MWNKTCLALLGPLLTVAAAPAAALPPPAMPAEAPSAALLRVSEPAGVHAPAVTLGDLTISAAFSRATAGRSGAAYLVVDNRGDAADRLVAADAPIAARVDIHVMTVVDDVMRMSPVDGGVVIPARGSATLAPGGMHVMMMGLDGPLEEGASFPLTLTFERAGAVTIDVPVLDAAADAPHGNGH